ncbi:MAG TPA: hypothetical protein VNO52_06940 [Methylomirabilota bacterium]|nr:hypothetical protein [Methylomirabilota bacterium]
MEQLRKLGPICRQHYEKIILVVALLLLAGAVIFLSSASRAEADKLREQTEVVTRKSVQGVKPVDLTRYEQLMARLSNPPPLILSGDHSLFSPVRWQTNYYDGKPVRVRSGQDVGPDKLVVTAVRPLELIVAFDRATGSGYYLRLTNQSLAVGTRGYVANPYLNVNQTNRSHPVIIREVTGAADKPDSLTIEFTDSGEKATLTPAAPVRKVLGYEADLYYPLEDKKFPSIRVNSTIRFANDDYKVIAINQNEVVITASNGRPHRRPFGAVPKQ